MLSILYAATKSNRFWLLVGIGLSALVCPAHSRAQDPVEELRQALRMKLADRSLPADERLGALIAKKLDAFDQSQKSIQKKRIEAVLPRLQTISQLRRAYFLPEWVGAPIYELGPDEPDPKARVAAKLKAAIETAGQKANAADEAAANRQIAAAILIAEIGENITKKGAKDLSPEEVAFARGLTDVVVELARANDPAVRGAAFHALGKIRPLAAKFTPVIGDALKNDATSNLGPKRLAAFALVDLAKTAGALDPKVTIDTLRSILVTARLGLNDPDEWTKGYTLLAIIEAAKAFNEEQLGIVGTFSADNVLTGMEIEKSSRDVLETLRDIAPELTGILHRNHANPKLTITALQGLEQVGNVRFALLQKLESFDPSKHDNPAGLLKEFKAPDPLAKIVAEPAEWKKVAALLNAKDVGIRRAAIEFLRSVAEEVTIALEVKAAPGSAAAADLHAFTNAIAAALADEDRWVRLNAVRTLRHFDPKEISPTLVFAVGDMLRDPDPDLSAAAAAALADLGPLAAGAVDKLVKYGIVLGDVENRVQSMTVLVRIGDAAALPATPALTEMLNDPEVRIRRAAAATLGRFGPAASAALPALRLALRDSDPTVRLHASEAILSITPLPRKGL